MLHGVSLFFIKIKTRKSDLDKRVNMSNDGFGKTKQKRTHGQSKPYERRKSLLGRVTDTVKDLIAPSWLSSFVGKPATPQRQDSPGDIAEVSEDEPFMSPPQSPPNHTLSSGRGSKQALNHHDGPGLRAPLSHYSGPLQVSTPFIRSNRPEIKTDHGLHNVHVGRLTSLQTHVEPTTTQTDDNMSDHSDGSKSTSGCSSMVPHPDKREYQKEILQLDESSLEKLKDRLHIPRSDQTSTPLPSTSQSKETFQHRQDLGQSIITDTPGSTTFSKTWTSSFYGARLRDTSTRNKPSFNMSLFGAPGMGNTSLFGESLHESMHYPGKVGYGGASQFRKGKNKPVAPYEIAAPYRTKIKARPVAKANSDALTTSSTAKRILEALERMSSPLTDAKKIPVDLAQSDSMLSFTPNRYLKKARTSLNSSSLNRRTLGFPIRGPPVNQLNTPTIASIAKNRQRLSFGGFTNIQSESKQSILTQSNQPSATEATSGLSQHSSIRRCDTLAASEIGRTGGKMKREKSHHYSSKKPDEDEDVIEAPNLKTDFTLPVVNMPKFNFASSSVTTPTTLTPAKSVTSVTQKSESGSNMEFTFSSPIANPPNPQLSPGTGTPKLNFQFSSPINVNDKKLIGNFGSDSFSRKETKPAFGETNIQGFSSRTDVNFNVGNSNFKFGSSSTSNIPANSTMASYGAPSELKTGSVMSILGGQSTSSSEPTSGGFKPAGTLKQGSVMDILYGKSSPVQNNPSDSVQPAGTLKPGSVMDFLNKGSAASKADETWAKLCAPTDQWECDICLIRNKPEISQCVACGGKKPASKSAVPVSKSGTMPSVSGGSLLEQFKPPPGSWECPECMIQNKASSISCVACATAQPASNKPTATTSAASKSMSGFGTQFLPPSGSWQCDTCWIENKADDTACVACQGLKPGGKTDVKKSGGSWECYTCMSSNKEEAVKCIFCETPRPGSKASTGGLTISSNAFSSGPSGFNLGSSTDSKNNDPVSFKFGTSSSDKDTSTSSIQFGTKSDNKDSTSTEGFKFGVSTDSKETSIAQSSGFKFGSATNVKDSSSNGGVKFGSTATDNKGGTSAGGFNFGVTNDNKKSASPAGGFIFDTQSDNKNSASIGGFKFSDPAEKDISKSGSFNKTSESSTTTTTSSGSGFLFGSSKDTLPTATGPSITFGTPSNPAQIANNTPAKVQPFRSVDNSETKPQTAAAGGFSFGKTSGEVSAPAASSQFQFGQSFAPLTQSKSEVKQESQPNNTDSVTGGFNFGQPASSISLTDSSKMNSNFTFGQSTTTTEVKTLNNNTEVKFNQDNKAIPSTFSFTSGIQKTKDSKPAMGGFSVKPESQNVLSQSSTAFTGFNSVKTETPQTGLNLKRTSDDVDSEPTAKKSFNFSSNQSSSVPVFGSTLNATDVKSGGLTNDLFKFGQAPATATPPSNAPLGTGGFNSISSGSTAPTFGSSSSFGGAPSTTGGALFGTMSAPAFGQTNQGFGTNAVTPTFGATTEQKHQTAPALFGAKASTFGGTSAPAFGSTFGANSTASFGGFNSSAAPAFGSGGFGSSSVPSFGSPAPAATSNNTAPSTGGFNFSAGTSFNFGSSAAAPSSGVFQFGAKADAGPSAATAPQPPQNPVFGQPQPGQQPAQAFNFSATPTNSSTPFTNSAGKNVFSVQGAMAGRRYKKAVRKVRK